MDITIRPAKPEDIPRLCGLLAELFSIETDFKIDLVKQVKGLTMLLHDPSDASLLVAAARGDEIIGMGTAQLIVSTAEGGAVALVEDIIVRKEYRGAGIGAGILSLIEQWCKERRATRLQLLADRNNTPALDFYSHRGWASTNLVCLRKYI
jgi:GNAT superfamily N-acetyltransferase